MNRAGYLCLIFLLPVACTGQYYSDAIIAEINKTTLPANPPDADTVMLNLDRSQIAWKGTKMWGRGMHTGVVPVKDGYLLFRDGRLTGGIITADMTSIGITDIPPDQPEPIRILTSHLEDPLFFDVSEYPESIFSLTNIEYINSRELVISGNFTIKDVTKNITIPASVSSTDHVFTTSFRIDRFDWSIAYQGGFGATRFAARNFVDKYIELTVILVVVPSEDIYGQSISGKRQKIGVY